MVLPKWLMFTMPLSCLYSEHMKSKISITTTTTNGSKMWFLKLKAIGRREYFHQGLLYYSVCVPLYVQGTFLVNQAVGRAAAKAKLKSASIVNISSIVGKVSQFFCCCCFCCCCCCCFFCCCFLGGVIWYCYKYNAEKLRDIFEFSITGRFSMTVIRNFVRF